MRLPKSKILKVKVTKSDIKNGICKDERKCAIACALRRVSNKKLVNVSPWKVYFRKNGFETSNKVNKFMANFDEDKSKVSPVTLKLDFNNKTIDII